ncbi:MAG: hypothetical protein Q9201_004889 [Fulgogasparrea decipioides]
MGDDVLLNLEKEYCPPIDTALFYAVILDYDLSDALYIKEARRTLDILKESATTEGDKFFDPSGTSGSNDVDGSSSQDSAERAQSWHGDLVSGSTDLTSISHQLDSLSIVDRIGDVGNGDDEEKTTVSHQDLDSLSVEQKKTTLCEMFPTIREFDIEYVLKKGGYNFGKAVEELLNQAFLEVEAVNGEEQLLNKGVEAFLEPNARGRKHKGKRKKQTRRTSSTPAPSDILDIPTTGLSRWDRVKEDVDFIAQRTYIPVSTISSIYHASGASLPSAITALCTASVSDYNPHVASLDLSIHNAHAAELMVDFPTLSYATAKTLIQLTHPSTASAHELARAAVASSASNAGLLVPQYAPRPPSPPATFSQSKTKPLSMPFDMATRAANASLIARSNAFAQASAAHRKSKSKPLMSGAASYYSSIGRDASSSLRRYEAAAADARVTSQSRAGEIDLHGVHVQDAVRITQDRVAIWWETEGQEWARAGKVMGGGGLRIVTGVGRHSEGGRGKLGPAVGAMLIEEGWKVEVGQGVVTVVGRVRR